MRVGVVSDTHLPRFGRRLPDALRRGLIANDVQQILHLGDFTDPAVAALFEEIAPFDGVAGNNDGEEIVRRYGRRKVVSVGGVAVGLLHGDGHRGTTVQRAASAFRGTRVDAVLFGHSHIPHLERVAGGLWLFNPGSPTDKRRQRRFSFGILDVSDAGVQPTLHFYEDRAAV